MDYYSLTFNTVVILVSLFIILKAADLVVYGVSGYAKKLGLSNYLAGLVIVSVAASMPEVISSLSGLFAGHEEMMIGAILGNNMVHMALLIGILALVGKNMKIESPVLEKSKFLMWVLLLLPIALFLDGKLGRIDGLVLILCYGIYMGFLWHREKKIGKLKEKVHFKDIWRYSLIFLGSLLAMLMAGRWLVIGAINIAEMSRIPTFFIALTIIGVGSAIDDFAIGIRSVLQGKQEIGIGDALGSILNELVLFFGIVALIRPIEMSIKTTWSSFLFLGISISLVVLFLRRKRITWKDGLLMIGIYAAFIAVEVWKFSF
ncbi:MAG: sodium:calcium antiporter [Nanoarchaeota archaeon]|nr:sodium:calcium antiporter [Nanoarchaeota archaeon]